MSSPTPDGVVVCSHWRLPTQQAELRLTHKEGILMAFEGFCSSATDEKTPHVLVEKV